MWHGFALEIMNIAGMVTFIIALSQGVFPLGGFLWNFLNGFLPCVSPLDLG